MARELSFTAPARRWGPSRHPVVGGRSPCPGIPKPPYSGKFIWYRPNPF